jgi:tetratricopeptide (TPR) repeat protein
MLLVANGSNHAFGAETSKSTNTDNKTNASKILAEGNRLSSEGQYLEALEKFRAAYELYPSPKLLLNIGTMQRQLGRNVQAAATYEAYIRDPEADPKQIDNLQRVLQELDAVVARLRIRVAPADSKVTLDGEVITVPPEGIEKRLEPGVHNVVAEKKGFPATVKSVTLIRGEKRLLELLVDPTLIVDPTLVKNAASKSALGTSGYIIGGVGVLGLLGGATAAIVAKVENDRAMKACEVSTARCDGAHIDAGSNAVTAAQSANVAFLLGGAATATGLALWLVSRRSSTAPTKDKPQVTFVPGPRGFTLSIHGVFE